MEGRRPLHYGIFLAAGGLMVIVSGVSLLFSKSVNQTSMKLFLGIGSLFLLVGIIKLIMKKISQVSDNEKKFRKKMSGVGEIDREERKMAGKSKSQNIQTSNNIITCPRCGGKSYSSSNYCHMCGLRLKNESN
jgi:hypothetical protein